jgi:hypothetical protein
MSYNCLKPGVLMVLAEAPIVVYFILEGFNCFTNLSRERALLPGQNIPELKKELFYSNKNRMFSL